MNEESDEAQSTEEVMRKIEEANKILAEKGVKDISLGSMGVVVLYPSLDQEESARIVAESIMESEVDIEGVDLDIAGVYLAIIRKSLKQAKSTSTKNIPQLKCTRENQSPS